MPESYLHRYSKIVLASWLRKHIRIGKNFKGLKGFNLDLDWAFCKNCTHKGMYSVYMEYPICKDLETNEVIGKSPDSWKNWLTKNCIGVSSKSGLPNVFEIKSLIEGKHPKLKILHTFDVVIIDKDGLKYVFEICHKHGCENKKIKWLEDNDVIGYELEAQWIMERVDCPYNVEIKRRLTLNIDGEALDKSLAEKIFKSGKGTYQERCEQLAKLTDEIDDDILN